ncbi:ABC transporter substrate-binding protein [Celeribacter halophilus]|uniref:Amino acid/amide ABC transporter substrate-binding protein, HAAT family (TC 3.A.1.4.-) n=1 Tax=Celeribacter halophilus TaxID=576117 RepID=A0A1I3RQM9_9RHOB|nr:ABC transporter substrate-binding protein [Celeribacter halophilus]PZX12705.1 branched-chain amino acid transport system substrate-binding protein [Celeribacter halophilus]SFJ48202.1 amino acid/amide ABC transporter substrate-binding protein, HAAT family (TC 3.A.1.4.-) [Celeribacter halophilus]
MSSGSLAQRLAVAGSLPRLSVQDRAPVRIGALVPMSGGEEFWGRPGVEGCELWVDWINAHGGMMIGGRRHLVELTVYDSGDGPEATLEAARQMVETQRVRLVLTLGGSDMRLALPYLMQRRILTATLLPSDLSPDFPYLIAPAEVHPFFNVTGVDWLARNRPEARRVALCSQTDLLGLPSLATYRAAFDVAAREVVKEVLYDVGGADPAAIVAEMMSVSPDVLCWCSSNPQMIEEMTVAAFEAGFAGEILACTCDNYQQLIARTSPEFMERFTFQFPDFDDPELADTGFFFHRPKAFYDRYTERFPGHWTAVSWEYASILDLWHEAVETADSLTSVSVLAALKRGRRMPHAFGLATWWGMDVYGIDNALVGDWPVVAIRDGKARIQEFGSVLGWLEAHGARLMTELGALGQLWHQRDTPDLARAMARE